MKVLLSGGGTAGHITPLLAVAKELERTQPGTTLLFIGQKGDKNSAAIERCGLFSSQFGIRAGKFRRFHNLSLWQNIINVRVNLANIRDAVLVCIGFVQSLYILVRVRPDVIFFKGGFVVVPVGYAARLLRVPYMTHDSDPLPGLANRLIAKGAKKNAVVSELVTTYPADKMIVTGIPLQREYDDRRQAEQAPYKRQLGFPEDCTLLFVFTGSQGARLIDDALEQVLPGLLKSHQSLYVAYVFGRLNEDSMRNRYQGLGGPVSKRLQRMTFIDNAYDYIAASDVIIGRAGATTLAEFATIGRACIIVPAEQLTGGHQLMNAKEYLENEAIRVVREKDMGENLRGEISRLLESPRLRHGLEKAIRAQAAENAARRIAELLLEIGSNKRAVL
jgi:UDP-N-acetylglucosamine--N-acetylmuramyl-(pentapeptide) pyrophosphoryl-undecaprenol N-acetylglucosamine transferase